MKTAINLMKEYGLDNIKAEIKNSPVHALVARIGALEDKSHLIGGREQDDQKLRAMAMVLEEVRESIQCLLILDASRVNYQKTYRSQIAIRIYSHGSLP